MSKEEAAAMKEASKKDTVTVPMSGLMDLIKELQANQIQAVREMMIEMKKPSPEEEAKQKEELERAVADRERMIEIAKEREAFLKRSQEMCAHKNERGGSTVNGQAHSDGMIHDICLRCGKAFKPRPVPADQMQYLR